jgi:hypothetical protein
MKILGSSFRTGWKKGWADEYPNTVDQGGCGRIGRMGLMGRIGVNQTKSNQIKPVGGESCPRMGQFDSKRGSWMANESNWAKRRLGLGTEQGSALTGFALVCQFCFRGMVVADFGLRLEESGQ